MKKNLPALLILLLFPALAVYAQKNISLLGNLKFPGKTLAGVWQYVDSNNNEYALVGTNYGLSIVNITVPSSPVLLFDVPGVSPNKWREVRTHEHYAYVCTEGGGGITIVKLDSLPLSVSYKTYTGDGAIAGLLDRAHSLQTEDGYLYINGATGLASGGVIICDLADPWNPVYVGEENQHYAHDCFIRNDTLWASEIYQGQFSVYDIINKANPVLIASQATPGAFNHNGCLSDDGRYFFTTDELPNKPVGVFDVSDLSNIKQVDLYYTLLNPDREVHNVRYLNDYLINPSYGDSAYGSQLTICDVARPENTIETGNFPLGGPTTTLSISWDASPYLPSGNIIATDYDSGLFILSPTYTRACYLEGTVTDSITGNVLNNVLVEILATTVTDSTILTGEYKTGLADPGIYAVKFSKPGYQTKTINNVSLTNGVLTLLDVTLWDGTVGIGNQNQLSAEIEWRPNPFSDFSALHFPEGYTCGKKIISVMVTDVTGRLVEKFMPVCRDEMVLKNNRYESGIYFYSVYENQKQVACGKLVKE